jgi:hypothetical protein
MAQEATRGTRGTNQTSKNNNAAPAVPERTDNVAFLTIAQFKEQVGTVGLSILKNPNTDKLFMSTDGGENYKVQQDIDTSLEMRVLVPDDNLEEACLINVNTDNMAEVIATL